MNNSLFLKVAREAQDNPIPEEGSTEEVKDIPVGEMPSQEEAGKLPETPPELNQEASPAGASEPVESKTPEAEPASESSDDGDDEDDLNDDLEDATASIEDTGQVEQEVAKMTITIESLIEQITEGDVDDQARSIINLTAAGIEQDIGADPEVVPATESMDNWSVRTLRSLESLRSHALRGRKAAKENLVEAIRDGLDVASDKLNGIKGKLEAAIQSVQANAGLPLKIDLSSYPGLTRSTDSDDQALQASVRDICLACDGLSGFVSRVLTGKLSATDGWSLALKDTFTLSEGSEGSHTIDLTAGVGSETVVGTLTKAAAADQPYQFTYELAPAMKTDTRTLSLDQATTLDVLNSCKQGLDAVISAHLYLVKTQDKLAQSVLNGDAPEKEQSYGALLEMSKCATAQLIPRALTTINTVIEIAS